MNIDTLTQFIVSFIKSGIKIRYYGLILHIIIHLLANSYAYYYF